MALTKILTEGIKDGEILNADINGSAAIARTKLANVDVVDDTTPQLGGNLDVNTKNIVFGDSSDGSSDDVLSFGASGDLKIFHQADQSRIVESGPSVLKIMGSDVRISNAGNTADYIQCNDGTNVRLFYNNSVKFETTDSGVKVTDAILEIAKKAISKKTGARGLRSILENILLKTMFELPDMENVIKVTVDRASVKGQTDPIVTYGKKSSTSVA